MYNILEKLYKRYNQFGEFYGAYTVKYPYTMIRILNDSKKQQIDIDKKIKEYEIEKFLEKKNNEFQGLIMDSKNIQPKSILIRTYYLELIASAIPESFFLRMGLDRSTIVELSLAIMFYYFGLQTYKFSDMKITDTEKKNLIGRTDFYIELSDIQKVRGKSTSEEYGKYKNIFAKDINEIRDDEKVGLFLDGGKVFIICISEFLDYMIYKLENTFKENCFDKEYSDYTTKKGYAFEEMVYGIIKNFTQESYHTLFYYPNDKQKIEIDVLLKDAENLAVLECKSGTFDSFIFDKDEELKLQIYSKTKKAYKSLKRVSEYLICSDEYRFECDKKIITGFANNPICIHVSMYPMDFIASNVHTLFPKYLEGINSPILTISLEHLLAIMIDAKKNNKDIFEYWELRKQDIAKYPGIHFDNNEIDLYYEIINKDTMFTEIKSQGLLDLINQNGIIISTFHNEFGDEIRPAAKILLMLDQYLLFGFFERGKRLFGINKRYLKNLENYLRID